MACWISLRAVLQSSYKTLLFKILALVSTCYVLKRELSYLCFILCNQLVQLKHAVNLISGEITKNTRYRTQAQVCTEFIIIPTYVFESKIVLSHELSLLAGNLNYLRPTTPEVYKAYTEACSWKQYKRDVVTEVLRRSRRKRAQDAYKTRGYYLNTSSTCMKCRFLPA